jgi:hypothetical protein
VKTRGSKGLILKLRAAKKHKRHKRFLNSFVAFALLLNLFYLSMVVVNFTTLPSRKTVTTRVSPGFRVEMLL